MRHLLVLYLDTASKKRTEYHDNKNTARTTRAPMATDNIATISHGLVMSAAPDEARNEDGLKQHTTN